MTPRGSTKAIVDFTALLFDTLGYTSDEFVSLGYEDTAGVFHTAVMTPTDAAASAHKLPATANAYFGVNPVTGPARKNCGRGKEADVTRLTGMWVDLDLKPGGCPSLDVAHAIVANLSIILGTRPSVTVDSGHGLHAYWPISDGHITDGDFTAARTLLKRWGRLVAVVAETLNVKVDNVYDLPRMLRVPGTYNNKRFNGEAPPSVVAHADTGGPLTMAEVDERLTEVGIDEEDNDRSQQRETVSPPADWVWPEQTCPYVAKMLEGWATDSPKPGKGRHQWLLDRHVRLACAHRLGCITENDHRRACQIIEDRFTEVVQTTEPRREPKRFEIEGKKHSAREYGITKVATKTDEEAREGLGGHTHGQAAPPEDTTGDDDDVKHSGHLGMAYKLAKQFGNKFRYVNNVGWHYWDGKRWARDENGSVRRAVHSVIQRDRRIIKRLHLPEEEEQQRLKQIARYESASAISGILTEAAALQVFSVTVADLDADPYLLNCVNGTLDLRTMKRQPHNPCDLITKVTRAAYVEGAVDTTWATFLEEIVPSKDIRDYLRRVLGVALLGKVIEHNLVILTGKGRNGKGTLYQALCFAFGDYADMADPQLFMERKGETSQGEMALLGLRLAVVSESGRGRALDEARMKRLTGGDIISGRYLYQRQISFTPSHLALFVTNHLPKVSGDDAAVWARLRVVPFNEVFDDDVEAQDKHLDEKLQAQAAAILAWAVAGWADYGTRGERLDAPPEVQVATEKYRTDSDDVGRFLADENWVLQAPTLKSTTSQLHDGYLRWAKAEGGEDITLKALGQALDAKGFSVTSRTEKGRWREGLANRPREARGRGNMTHDAS